jgi:hypothetical protein
MPFTQEFGRGIRRGIVATSRSTWHEPGDVCSARIHVDPQLGERGGRQVAQPKRVAAAPELRRVVDALAEVIENDAIGPWLEQPNRAFEGLKPMEAIERGELDRIWQMIYYLRSGTPS